MVHGGVIRPVGVQQLLVGPEERTVGDIAVVPEQHHPAAGLEEAEKFPARRRPVEPVERLTGGDEVHAVSRQRGGFRRAGDAGKIGVVTEHSFGSRAHVRVGFHGQYPGTGDQ